MPQTCNVLSGNACLRACYLLLCLLALHLFFLHVLWFIVYCKQGKSKGLVDNKTLHLITFMPSIRLTKTCSQVTAASYGV